MRYIIGKFITGLTVVLLGATGAAQANHVMSTNPADWWIAPPNPTNPNGVVLYVAPSESTIPPVGDPRGDRIRYGKRILEETYAMLGPDSKFASAPYVKSRLSCTNCHLESGKAAYGQPWAAIVKKYVDIGQPGAIWSARSNVYLDMRNRIHDCTMRSMNGFKLPDTSDELESMIEYMKWLAEGIKVSDWNQLTPHGASNVGVTELTRPADPVRGKTVYEDNCAGCHGYTGEGIWDAAAKKYIYPAVWGEHSFNDGAGMFRLRTAVGFIKGNMPFGWANPTDPTNHQLSTDDAWDSMAYVLEQDRPRRADNIKDWLYTRPSDCAPNWLLKVTQLDAGYESYYPRRNPATGKLSGNLAHPPKYTKEQHKYGPWRNAGNDMVKEMQDIQAAWLAQKPVPKPAVCPDPTEWEYTPP